MIDIFLSKCIGLTRHHPILKAKRIQCIDEAHQDTAKTVVGVTVSSFCNGGQKKVGGKRKKGGIWLEPQIPVVTFTCADGQEYPLNASVRGKLIEINPRVLSDPAGFFREDSGVGGGGG